MQTCLRFVWRIIAILNVVIPLVIPLARNNFIIIHREQLSESFLF